MSRGDGESNKHLVSGGGRAPKPAAWRQYPARREGGGERGRDGGRLQISRSLSPSLVLRFDGEDVVGTSWAQVTLGPAEDEGGCRGGGVGVGEEQEAVTSLLFPCFMDMLIWLTYCYYHHCCFFVICCYCCYFASRCCCCCC